MIQNRSSRFLIFSNTRFITRVHYYATVRTTVSHQYFIPFIFRVDKPKKLSKVTKKKNSWFQNGWSLCKISWKFVPDGKLFPRWNSMLRHGRPHQRAISLSSLFTKFLIKWIFLNFTTSDFERNYTVTGCHWECHKNGQNVDKVSSKWTLLTLKYRGSFIWVRPQVQTDPLDRPRRHSSHDSKSTDRYLKDFGQFGKYFR